MKKTQNQIQKEILNLLPPKPHGRLELSPRFGKTKLIINLIKRDKPSSILWVTPSRKLADTDIQLEFVKWKAEEYLERLSTTTYASLPKVIGQFEMVILDEEQHLTELNSESLLNPRSTFSYSYIISMTGISTEHKDKQELYKRLKLKTLYSYTLNEAREDEIIADYNITVVEITSTPDYIGNYLEAEKAIAAYNKGTAKIEEGTLVIEGEIKGTAFLSPRESKHGNKGKLYAIKNNLGNSIGYVVEENGTIFGKLSISGIEYKITNGIVHKPYPKFLLINRAAAIGKTMAKTMAAKRILETLKGRVLVFCSSISQAEALLPHTYHSKTNDSDLHRFLSKEIDRIAMVKSGGTGFTYKEIDHLVLIQVDGDKNGLTSQKLARSLLKQKNYKAHLWILKLMSSPDEAWVDNILQKFDSSKISNYSINIL